MSKVRTHLEDNESEDAILIKHCLVAICTYINATKSKDLEADIEINGVQYHIDVSEVAKNV